MKPNTHKLPHDITRCHGHECAVRYTCARFVLLNDGEGMISQIAHGRIENGACVDRVEMVVAAERARVGKPNKSSTATAAGADVERKGDL